MRIIQASLSILGACVLWSSAAEAQAKFNAPVKVTPIAKQQMIIGDAMSRGSSLSTAKSLAVNGPSYTSINPPKPLAPTPAKSLEINKVPVVTATQKPTAPQLYYNQSTQKNPTATCKMTVVKGKATCVY